MSRAGVDVRTDLEQVFRSHYPRVVAVAARVLGAVEESTLRALLTTVVDEAAA